MTDTSFGDYIAFIYALITSFAVALFAAGSVTPSEIATACRGTAEGMEDDPTRSLLLSFADRMDRIEAQADLRLAPRWTPEVVPGGKDEDDAT